MLTSGVTSKRLVLVYIWKKLNISILLLTHGPCITLVLVMKSRDIVIQSSFENWAWSLHCYLKK
jgi:hypothetical protein